MSSESQTPERDSAHRPSSSLPTLEELQTAELDYRLRLVDDHDTTTLPRPLAISIRPPPSLSRLRVEMRSWESLDRISRPAMPNEIQTAYKTQVWPFLRATRLDTLGPALSQDHCLLTDHGLLLPWPEPSSSAAGRLRELESIRATIRRLRGLSR